MTFHKTTLRTITLSFLFWSTWSLAFSNAYLSFEQPEGWTCELVQKAWICQSENPADRKDALIMTIASLATDWDKVENYEEYLKTPKTIGGENNEPTVVSEVSYARKRNINGHVWVDSYHHNSELPGFWTRYTVTVHETAKSKLAILVTYVVSDEKRAQFAPQFERMVSYLKPNSEFDLNAATRQGDVAILQNERLGTGKLIADRLDTKKKTVEPGTTPQSGNDSFTTILILAGAVAAIGFILVRSRRKKA